MDTQSYTLGINGLGRIGKLTLWHHVSRKFFTDIVVNIGRNAGQSFDDIVHYIERDSTYGRLAGYLHGCMAKPVIEDIDPSAGTMKINGVNVRFLRTHRNPREIEWADHSVRLVVDATGQFLDPETPSEDPKGSLRGHLAAGVQKVIASAPFKLRQGAAMPDDAVTTVMGINDKDYNPARHCLISNASCTTNCLAHMVKPLLDYFGVDRILSASMATVHAATGSQQVLDRLPKSNATDMRKNRSIMNNIILTSTGAAKALQLVIPEMSKIGFIAESVRIPTVTGSLVILVLNFQEDPQNEPIRRELINQVYKDAAAADAKNYLLYSDKQNVSSDIIGIPRAATLIEGQVTHTRTANLGINLAHIQGIDKSLLENIQDQIMGHLQVTQAVVYGWYDNELGSYVNMLGDRTVSVAQAME